MNENLQLALTHAVCLGMLAGAFWLSGTALAPYPEVARTLIAAVAGLYGKLAFKPLQAVLERALAQLTPDQLRHVVRRAESSRPPPPMPVVGDPAHADTEPGPFPLSPSARPPRSGDGGQS